MYKGDLLSRKSDTVKINHKLNPIFGPSCCDLLTMEEILAFIELNNGVLSIQLKGEVNQELTVSQTGDYNLVNKNGRVHLHGRNQRLGIDCGKA